MVYKWNEIDCESFFEILEGYYNKLSWSKGKVLEVQNISGIFYSDEPQKARLFFGADIDPMKWNMSDKTIKLIKLLVELNRSTIEDFIREHVALSLIMTGESSPKMVTTPILRSAFSGVFDLIKGSMFSKGNSPIKLNMWYTKDGDKIKLHQGNDVPDRSKLVRCRSIDYADWEEIIKKFSETGNFDKSFTDLDIDATKVVLCEE